MPAAAQPSHMVQFELRRALNAFRNESVSELAGYVDRIARNMKYERSSVNNAISTMHAYIAQGFYAEVMAAYKSSSIDRTHPYRWTGSAPYRRYAKGAMERALSSEGMVSYDNRSMSLIGRESLDQIARQWYRLNFGEVESANYVLINGSEYNIDYWAPPVGLFGATVYQAYLSAVDEV